jgi:peptidoglycan/LPS O-acetylase OafA/YrhL
MAGRYPSLLPELPPSAPASMPGLDGLRALAVTLVVLFHIHGFGTGSPTVHLAGIDLRPWLGTGFIGVHLFFVLSGFLLMQPWANSYHAGHPPPRLYDFYRRRILRIVPAYYAHLVIFFFLLVPLVHSFATLFSPLGILSIFAHLTFTQYLFPHTSASFGINGSLWTLTIEALFYLSLPFFAPWFLGRKAFIGLAIALLISSTWRHLSFHSLHELALWVLARTGIHVENPFVIQHFLALQFPGQVIYFAAGMALANLTQWRTNFRFAGILTGKLGSALVVALLAGTFWLMWLTSRISIWQSNWMYTWHILAATMLGLLVLVASRDNSVSLRLLGATPPRIIGQISYGIYLWHLPVIYLVRTYLLPHLPGGMSPFVFMLMTCIPPILLIAYASYVHIELPYLQKRG